MTPENPYETGGFYANPVFLAQKTIDRKEI